MKIGLVLPSVPAYSETFFRNKIIGLQRHGCEVILFVNSVKKNNDYLNCTIVNAPELSGNILKVGISTLKQVFKAIFFNPKKSYTLYKLNKKDGISITENIKQVLANQFILSHTVDWLHFGFGTMALGRENIARVIGAKMAVSFRGFDIGIYPLKHPNCYKELFKKVDKIHVISDDLTDLLYKSGLSKEKQIVKITPAIDTSFFTPVTKTDNSILQLSTIARLHWKKGLEYTLEALSKLKNEGIEFEYTIIGDGIEKERLLFAAYQLGIKENVNFAGKLSPSEVKEELEKTDIYLQYSIQEGFCNAVLEAQAMGLLCIVSNAEGLSENVLDKQTGWVVEKRKPALLAEKIKDVMLLSPSEKQKIKTNAIRRVQQEFNLEKQQKEFLEFYNL